MPAIRYYTVTETRSLRIVANNEVDALRLAALALRDPANTDHTGRLRDKADLPGVWGDTESHVRVVSLAAVSDR